MEDELFFALYRLILRQYRRRRRQPYVQFNDAIILAVALWATVHDRPISWACQARHWPRDRLPFELPSDQTMSQRLKTLSVQLLLEQVFHCLLALAALSGFALARRLDSKPLPVGGFSKDRQARWGQAAAGVKCRGYKLFCCWNGRDAPLPEALVLGPMNESDQAAGLALIQQLQALHGATLGGYLLADATHDTNPLHAYAGAQGLQLLTRRKQPGTDLGHRDHSPYRLRSIQLLEPPALPVARPQATFGTSLYRERGQIERDYGNLCGFGGGLQPLPSWVRHPRRVARWVILKIIINAMRICRNHGLTP